MHKGNTAVSPYVAVAGKTEALLAKLVPDKRALLCGLIIQPAACLDKAFAAKARAAAGIVIIYKSASDKKIIKRGIIFGLERLGVGSLNYGNRIYNVQISPSLT